jgi:hypothetical protein
MEDEVTRNDYPRMARPAGRVVEGIRQFSWGAVWAGFFIALGMEVLLTSLGLYLGFGGYNSQAANPWSGASGWATIWYLLAAGWSLFWGAWCAARLSGSPRGGILHGITTWGLASAATIAVAALTSWAVLRGGIDVLETATAAGAPAARGAVTEAARQAAQAAGVAPRQAPGAATETTRQPAQAATQMAQATANFASGLASRVFGGSLVGFLAALLGGWLGRPRNIRFEEVEALPGPTRRAA